MTAATDKVRRAFLHTEALPVTIRRSLDADAGAMFPGWLAMLNAGGNVVPATSGATKVGQISAGVLFSETDAVASDGDADVLLEQRAFVIAQSSTEGDSFVQADAPAVAYAVDNCHIGKLGTERSVGGLFLGIDLETGKALLLPGPVAHAIALGLARGKVPSARWQKAATDGAANTATAESPVPREPLACRVVSAAYVPGGALTADDTDFATLTLRKRNGAGGSAVAIASVTTKITGGSGNWTAFVPVSLGTISNPDLLATDILTIEIAKAGSGVAVPLGYLLVKLAIG